MSANPFCQSFLEGLLQLAVTCAEEQAFAFCDSVVDDESAGEHVRAALELVSGLRGLWADDLDPLAS
jgi:hypothetical protein